MQYREQVDRNKPAEMRLSADAAFEGVKLQVFFP